MPVALLTGVSGQTGSYLAENLLARGWDVHGIQREDSRDPLVPAAVRLHQADLADFSTTAEVVAEVSPDTLWNLAALSSVAASWNRPLETSLLNGAAVANLLQAVDGLPSIPGGRGFVQAASAEIFGSADVSPQTESTPIRPVNPYGASKAYAHVLVGAYRAAGLRASSVVLYNHESPRRPEAFVTRKITAGVARIVRGTQSELVLGNLDAKRDWGWAPDYAEALALVGLSPTADDYVVATGESHTIEEFVAAAFSAAGVTDWQDLVRIDPAFVRPTDAVEMRGDSTRIRHALGWNPTLAFSGVVEAMVKHDLSTS
ncbi:GDP-mannose 4,6-dehydratase [Frondihabitans cladoniiphilus]|uniref:GDP-mannose 4,6-dehydratase n=1 Tax=Frondihabitans cladoniiphilus TaxID=715785 RepID=A0ABP8WET1_9MICO